MRFDVTVFRMTGEKKARIASKRVKAGDARRALAKAGFRLTQSRIVEIRPVVIERPPVNRPEREGEI